MTHPKYALLKNSLNDPVARRFYIDSKLPSTYNLNTVYTILFLLGFDMCL